MNETHADLSSPGYKLDMSSAGNQEPLASADKAHYSFFPAPSPTIQVRLTTFAAKVELGILIGLYLNKTSGKELQPSRLFDFSCQASYS